MTYFEIKEKRKTNKNNKSLIFLIIGLIILFISFIFFLIYLASAPTLGSVATDGHVSSATGSGAGSHHGGVDHWIKGDRSSVDF